MHIYRDLTCKKTLYLYDIHLHSLFTYWCFGKNKYDVIPKSYFFSTDDVK